MTQELFGGLLPTTQTLLLIKNCYSSAIVSYIMAGCVEAGRRLHTPVLNNARYSLLLST